MLGAIAPRERELKAERAAGGRMSAKARGRTAGRPRTDPDTLEQARILSQNSDKTAELRQRREQGTLIQTLMKDYGLSKASVNRYLEADARFTVAGSH